MEGWANVSPATLLLPPWQTGAALSRGCIPLSCPKRWHGWPTSVPVPRVMRAEPLRLSTTSLDRLCAVLGCLRWPRMADRAPEAGFSVVELMPAPAVGTWGDEARDV